MVSTISTRTIDPDVVPSPERLRMSYDDYLDWHDRDAGRRGEWVDGEVIVFMSTTYRHEELVTFLVSLLNYVMKKGRLGVVITPGYELRTRDGAAREPDLQVILNAHLDRITHRRLVGAADLVVEIVSDDSVKRDRDDKHAEYAAAGIPEYWIVDPREGNESLDIFALVRGTYVAVDPEVDGSLRSRVIPGVWMHRDWLLADELPDPFDIGAEIVRTF